MKKVLIVLAVLLCSVAVFAADNAVNLSVTPYSVQFVTKTGATAQTTSYGFGAEASYRRNVFEGLYAEAGIGYNTFVYAKKADKFYSNVLFFAGLGYKYDFNEKWSAGLHFDVADDLLCYKGTGSNQITIRTGLEGAYAFNSSFALTFKVDGSFGFAKDDSAKYVTYRVVPMVGCSYSF